MPIKATIRLRDLAIVSTLVALAAGCRNDPYLDSHIEILNAEKRALEDQLYELEYDYERKVAELEEAKARLGNLAGEGSRPRRSDQSPRVELPNVEDDLLDLSPPNVIPGVPDGASHDLPPPNTRARSPRGNTEPARTGQVRTGPVSTRTGPMLLEPDDPRITHIHIDPLHTGGSDFDQQPGDDGILVVVEPRNRNDAFVPLAGPLSVVVLDYAKRDAGTEARIGRWELTAQQVDKSLHNNSSQRGIYLRLPWGEDRPQSSKLMVAVRYTTADGRKLEATRDIFVTLPGQFSQRWTPRSSTDSESGDRQPSVNIARQPSANDGARVLPTPPRGEPSAEQIAPVSHEVAELPLVNPPSSTTWRPYR